MKEARIIIIISCIFMIIIYPLFYLLNLFITFDYMSFSTNLFCGIVVGFITATIQFNVKKREIINKVYNTYFDIYRTYYYSKNKPFLFHYNSYSVYKKIMDLGPKVSEVLDEYHGFFRKYNKLYKELNPTIELKNNYKAKKIIKTIFSWFNKKAFNETIGSFIIEVEHILESINKKRFEKDKESMVKMFNYIWK